MPASKFDKDQDKIIAEKYTRGMTVQEIAKEFGVYKQSVLNSLKRSKINRRKDWQRARGDKNSNWKNGTRIIKGYVHILYPEHHLARKDGYVPLHRLTAEKILGRELLKNEVVGHLDGNVKNNSPENLKVYKNNGEHIKAHQVGFSRNTKGRFVKK